MNTLEILSCEEQNLLDLANSSDTNYELACLLVNHQKQEFVEYFDRHVVQTFSKGFNLFCQIPTLNGSELKVKLYLEDFFIRKSIISRLTEIIPSIDYECSCIDFDKIIVDNNKEKFFFKELELNNSYTENFLIPKIYSGYDVSYKKLRFSFYLPLLLEPEEEGRNKYLQIIKNNFILEEEDESLIEDYELKKRTDSSLVDVAFNSKHQFLSNFDERLNQLEKAIQKDYILFFKSYFPNILKIYHQ